MLVVPVDVQGKLSTQVSTPIRDEQPTSALALDRSDQALDDCDAAVLADGSEPLTDPATTTPSIKVLVAELLALVGDQVGRRLSDN
jgi:hypothetical protein